MLFLLPWGRHWLVGTTDTDYEGDLDEPTVTPDDVDYLLGQANRWLARPLTHDDVVGVYSGLRPLLSAGTTSESTASLSREHAVVRPAPGFVVIAGGKWTTYRVMASDVVDAAVDELAALDPERWPDEVPECVTADIPVVGAEGWAEAWAARERTARRVGVPSEAMAHLLRRHGSAVDDVLALVEADPSLARRCTRTSSTCVPRSWSPRRTRGRARSRTSSSGGCASRSRSATPSARWPTRSPG